jgi:aspartyl-tRNA(Asn)/glutamyl-tRNA(Gln) amidotransferase subunit C
LILAVENYQVLNLTFLPPGYNTNMPLSIKEVRHIARLARLELTPEEEERYRLQLSDILDYFHKLQQLKISDETVNSSPIMPATVRPDEIQRGLSTNEVLQNTTLQEENQFKVPSVFGEQDE